MILESLNPYTDHDSMKLDKDGDHMKKRLERSRKENVLAGVCGGIAKYLNIDVIVVRAIWFISAVFGGPGLGTYIICAIIMPKEKYSEAYYENDEFDEYKDERSKNYMGLALIGIGAYMAFKAFLPDVTFRFLWPVLLIGVGLMLLNRDKNNEEEY